MPKMISFINFNAEVEDLYWMIFLFINKENLLLKNLLNQVKFNSIFPE
jgi:hypothetical protein